MTGYKLELRLGPQPHSPLENPNLTAEAEQKYKANYCFSLQDILAKGVMTPREKMIATEIAIFMRWNYQDNWEDYLDAPLIAHAESALALKNMYDAAIGIKEDGIPYKEIFCILGMPTYEIDFSHHEREMEKPVINERDIEELKAKNRVLLTDIDFVTGKTLREVTKYLKEKGVNVVGAYIGLSKWPGINSDKFYIGHDTVNFDTFWQGKFSGLSWLRSKVPYKKGIIPWGLKIYSPNPRLDTDERLGSAASVKITKYFLGK